MVERLDELLLQQRKRVQLVVALFVKLLDPLERPVLRGEVRFPAHLCLESLDISVKHVVTSSIDEALAFERVARKCPVPVWQSHVAEPVEFEVRVLIALLEPEQIHAVPVHEVLSKVGAVSRLHPLLLSRVEAASMEVGHLPERA